MPRKKKDTTSEYFEVFPARLRELFAGSGKSQQELGTHLGKTRQAVGTYADGSSSPDWKTIVQIARFFNVSSDYLLGLSDIPSVNSDIRDINNKTGLSQEAIAHLMANRHIGEEETTNFISYLLTRRDLPDLVKALKQKNQFLAEDKTALLDMNGETYCAEMSALFKLITNDLFWKIADGYKPLPGQIQLDSIASDSYTAK